MTAEAQKIEPVSPDAGAANVQAQVVGAYQRMLAYQFIGTACLAGGVGLALLLSYKFGSYSPPLLPLVMVAGMLGAFFSALTRLYNVDQAGVAIISPTVRLLEGKYMLMYSLTPPVIGAIASVVLYLIFVAGLLNGGLFPDISCVEGKTCKTVLELMENFWPEEPEDYGKALVWGFAAGFSERLVPDILLTLVKKGTAGEGK